MKLSAASFVSSEMNSVSKLRVVATSSRTHPVDLQSFANILRQQIMAKVDLEIKERMTYVSLFCIHKTHLISGKHKSLPALLSSPSPASLALSSLLAYFCLPFALSVAW